MSWHRLGSTSGTQRIPHQVHEPYGRSEKRVSELSTELLDEDMSSICRQRVMKCLGRWSSRFPALIPLAGLLDAMQLLAGRFHAASDRVCSCAGVECRKGPH